MFSLGPLSALGSSFTWALGSSGYSSMSETNTPFSVNFMRALIALPLFLLAVCIESGGLSGAWQTYSQVRISHWGWFTLSMVASYGFGDVLFLWSAKEIGVSSALAICSSFPILTALAGYFLQGQKLSALQIAGLLVTVASVMAVILIGAVQQRTLQAGGGERRFLKGALLAWACSFFWALNSFSVSQGGRDVTAGVANTLRMILALGICFGLSRLFVPGTPILVKRRDLKKWGWLFGLEAFGGSYLFCYGLAHSPLAIGSALASLAPAISVPIAWALRLERFSIARTAAVCGVVGGVWLLLGGAG